MNVTDVCGCDGTCERPELGGQPCTAFTPYAQETKEDHPQRWEDPQCHADGGKRVCVPCYRRVESRRGLVKASTEIDALLALCRFAPAWLAGVRRPVVHGQDDDAIVLAPDPSHARAAWEFRYKSDAKQRGVLHDLAGDLITGGGLGTTASAVLREVAAKLATSHPARRILEERAATFAQGMKLT